MPSTSGLIGNSNRILLGGMSGGPTLNDEGIIGVNSSASVIFESAFTLSHRSFREELSLLEIKEP